MEYKIYIFNNDKLQDIDFDFLGLQNILASYNADISVFTLQKFDKSLVSEIIKEGGNLILFFRNQDIDDVICDNIKILGNNKHIIDDQIALFNNDDKKIVFVPYDLNWKVLLGKINFNPKRGNKTCTFKLFSVSKKRVEEILSGLKNEIDSLEYSVLSRRLLVDVYISYNGTDDLIDDNQVKIATAFRDFIYSENSLGLSRSIRQIVNLKGIKLAICEGITGGSILKEICSNICIKELLAEGRVEYLKGDITADEVYKQTLTLFDDKDNQDIFAINVQGKFEEDGITCIYAMGNKNSIDVYKNTFKVRKEEAVEYAVEAILFNIVKKLRQNNLSF